MDGFLCLDKPSGITSFSAANRLRRILNAKKAGHTGTLDPLATGLLPVMLGGATKFADYLPDSGKVYTAEILFGKETDTLDITGKVVAEKTPDFSFEELEKAAFSFKGESLQVPPMYSAVSQNGVRLYKLARAGIETDRKARPINISEISVKPTEAKNIFSLHVACSKGTYVRSLIHDIGKALGCPACMNALRREKSNGFSLKNAVTLEEAEELFKSGEIESRIIPVEKALVHFPKASVTDAQGTRFRNGGALSLKRVKADGSGIFRIYCEKYGFLGLGIADKDSDEMKVAKLYIK